VHGKAFAEQILPFAEQFACTATPSSAVVLQFTLL
jgi:hypothetical protein